MGLCERGVTATLNCDVSITFAQYASWQMDCSFQVQPTDEFLNIYVWGEEQNNRTDVLLGRVSFLPAFVSVAAMLVDAYVLHSVWVASPGMCRSPVSCLLWHCPA